MSTFDFEAPLAGTTFGGDAVNAPLVDPLGEEQLFQDWLRFKEDEEEAIAAAENDAEEDRDQFIRRKRSRTLEHDEGEARNREPEQFEAEDELDRIREERELRNEQALQNILRREELRLQEVERRRLAAQPQLQAQQIDLRAQNVNNNNNNAGNNNDGFNLNVNLELGPDGIAAEVQAQGDMNAFMELVGIQGPIDMLLQNFALALFIVFAALGAGGWVPYMVGRLMLWLFFDVYYGVVKDGIDFGVKLLETLTDPVLDPIVDGLVVLVKWSGLVTVSNATVAAVAANFHGDDQIDKGSNVEPTSQFKSVVVSIGVTGNISDNGTIIEQHHEEKGQRFEYVSDLVAAVIAGYFTITFVLYHHARRSGHLRHPYAQTLKRMFYRGFRFLFLAIKFSFFITIELGMFPTFCGLLIDLCTLSCFGPDTTISTRLVFYNAYPWTSYFLHWLAGTTFMFQFAGYVQSVRKVVRPGVVWFIRDPEDPQFHPMQDILEKPVLTQLRKLSFGAMMYAVVVISTIGGYVGMVHVVQHLIGTKRDGGAAMFWPVKWEFSEPLSEFPIDLLIFHFVAPAVMSWIKPKELIVSVLKMYFRFAARRLRLTNFLFGERKVDEENGEVGDDPLVVKLFDEQGDGDVADLAPELENPAEIEDTTANQGVEATLLVPPAILPQQSHRATPYLRVPNHDRIPLKPGTKVMIPMARDAPLVGRVDENEDDIKANWIRVYVPSNLRLRLLGLVFFQWLFGVSLAVFLTMGPSLHNYFTNQPLAPLVLPSTNGTSPNLPDISINVTSSQLLRRFRLLSTGNSTSLGTSSTIGRPDLPVHDLFSLSFGLLVFVGVTIALIWLYKCTLAVREHYRRALLDDTNPGSTGEKLWKAAVEGANWAYDNTLMHIVTFWVGIAVPVLLGLLFEIYVVIPFVGDKAQTRVFFILQDWALGAIYTKVIHSIIMNAPDTELRRVLVQARDQIRQGGLHRLELRPVALKVILPVVLISVGLIFLPPFVFLFMAYLDGDGVSEPGAEMNDLLSRLLVPGLMALFLLYEFVRTTRRSVKRWMDQVRDEHYLVGRRLRNLGEPVAVPPIAQAAETQMAGGAAVGAEIAVDGENIPLLANGEDDDDWVDQDGVQI
ncbi:hypothetical protein BDR26DRAFT_891147 [Obelidium mucronatum]|nr:hypothetical protein BDR26DRAFT_891147 [Obelidium mucronatum]